MADSIGDLLIKRDYEEPPEIRMVKEFVRQHFDADVKVTIYPTQIIIGVTSSALAGALRMHLHEMEKLLASDKRLVIRLS